MDDWCSVGKKDSFDRELAQKPNTLTKLNWIRAVLVGKEGQAMRREVDEGISNNKSFGFCVKICRFPFARSGKGDFFKPSHFRFNFSLNKLGHFFAEPIMVGIRADNDDGSSG